MNSSLHSYCDDVNGYQTSDLGQTWNGSAWVNSSLNSSSYDGNGNRTTLLQQSWKNGGWVNSQLLQYTYEQVTAVEQASHPIPIDFALYQNYPNPFNPSTNIQFSIVQRQLTIVKVFDVLGRELATLVNEVKEPGTYTVQFNGSNLASGVYFYRLQAGSYVDTKKLVLLR